MATRKFRIINAEGDMVDTLASLNMFAASPEGLGVEFENTLYETNTNFLLDKSQLTNVPMQFTMVFGADGSEPYAQYHRFIQLLNKPPYTIEYELPIGMWRRECRLNAITKTEITNGDAMIETLTFDPLTPWFTEKQAESIPREPIENDGKIYVPYDDRPRLFLEIPTGKVPQGSLFLYNGTQDWSGKPENLRLGYYLAMEDRSYFDWDVFQWYAEALNELRYDFAYDYVYGGSGDSGGQAPDFPMPNEDRYGHAYTYDYIYEEIVDGSNGVFYLENNSIHMGQAKGSPVEITVYGPAKNPWWTIVRDSLVLQSDGFNIDIPNGYKLVVSSMPNKQSAKLIGSDGSEANVYQQQRLDLTGFVTIPEGSSKLVFYDADKIFFTYREEMVVV